MQSKSRDKIIAAAATLFRQRGYAATGVAEILQASGAPKGSLYHHFPGGKAEVGAQAVRHAGELVRRTLSGLRASESSASAMILAYGALLEGWMAASRFSDGCPITTTLLETAPADAAIAAAGRDAFESWIAVLGDALAGEGIDPNRAARLATAAVMLIEGALIVARVSSSGDPIRIAAEEAAAMFARERTSA